MICEQTSIKDHDIIIRKPTASLRALPAPSPTLFANSPPWSVASTSSLTAALNIDPGFWHVWRSRRIVPSPLPEAWFRRASGAPLYYRIDAVLAWLASRRSEPFSPIECWSEWLRTNAGLSFSSNDSIQAFARRWAEGDGPVQGDVRFTPAGFRQYLDSLGDAP